MGQSPIYLFDTEPMYEKYIAEFGSVKTNKNRSKQWIWNIEEGSRFSSSSFRELSEKKIQKYTIQDKHHT